VTTVATSVHANATSLLPALVWWIRSQPIVANDQVVGRYGNIRGPLCFGLVGHGAVVMAVSPMLTLAMSPPFQSQAPPSVHTLVAVSVTEPPAVR